MKNLAPQLAEAPTSLETGTVAGENEGCFTVKTAGGNYLATRAVSCLIKPDRGDTVLLCLEASGQVYVLSILRRPAGQEKPEEIILSGSAHIQAPHGALHLSARDGLRLSSPDKLTLAAEEFEVNAQNGLARFENFTFFGRWVHGRMERLKVIADGVDSVFRRLVQRLTSSYRYVEEHEEIQSASTRFIVDGTLSMQTRNTIHTAEGHIKMDAEQIHLG